ncbi:chemotaxis protein methyltransferase CheR [Sphingomonas laterariae]|uniref:Chemotaxis protein methyltransferase n=1 Tax=Edaphosphingomonas laterariae TaxID=861865 RepID=A0A239DBI8_9SPHN|nr:CheR family methyltransferase [Sphingomonas laterariae]SNS29482.1 chemotaxis protein methyltransferase CheR [Sphingomonas laterariae]
MFTGETGGSGEGASDQFPFTRADFQAIAGLVHSHAGIVLADGKAMLVYSRLTKLVRARGLDNFRDYVALLRNDREERVQAIEALTTNHTKFFRENHHFEHFAAHVRPALVEKAARRQRVRLWSAGSSSGEEVHSLMLTLLGTDMDDARAIRSGDVVALASDLNSQVLEIGRRGLYPAAVATDIPPAMKSAWMRASADGVQMGDVVRGLIRFRQLNLLNEWPIRGQFDVIFCRNTMIYFDEPTKERLIARLSAQLVPGGYLYIGHSERLVGPAADDFLSVGQTIYRKAAA